MKCSIYITVLCLSLALKSKAQQTVFDSVYYNDIATINEETEAVFGVSKIKNSFVGVVLGRNYTLAERRNFVFIADSVGHEVKKYKYPDDGRFEYNITAVATINDKKIMVVGTHLDSIRPDTAKIMVATFNENLDSLDFKLHPFPQPLGQFNQMLYDGNKYIYGTGFSVQDASAYSQLLVAKFDTTGNLIWAHHYGQSNRNETGMTLQLIGQDSLFIGGYNQESGNGDGDAVLLDTAGNLIWFRYIDVQGQENIFAGGFKHKDGGYVMPGQVYFTATGNDLCFVKLDASGFKTGEKIHSLGIKHDFTQYSFFNETDSTVVATGGNCNVPLFYEAGLAVKYTMEGDTMWTRTYDRSYNMNGIDHFYKGVPANDGGYLFAGQTANGVVQGKQDGWLLKTDSIGCNPNYPCWPATHYEYTGLKENTVSGQHMEVFPNPANDFVYVRFKNIYQNNACTLSLYDITGKLVKEQKYNTDPVIGLNLQGTPAGMYILQVKTLYSEERMKIVKE